MFFGSAIRKLAPSEEMFANSQTFCALMVDLIGAVDVGALSEAFDALLQSHPILACHLERSGDHGHHIVARGLHHPGMKVIRGVECPTAGTQLDQTRTLTNLRVKVDDDHCELTLFVHHALADAHHVFSLFEELFGRYTDLVDFGDVGPVIPQPVPDSLEQVLEKRGVSKTSRSGFERFGAVRSAEDLPATEPPPVLAKSDVPQRIPVARIRFTEQETTDLIEFGLANQLSLNSLVAAAILLAEWELRDGPHLPIPYLYPVDLRYLVSPPIGDTASTNPVGIATFLAEIGRDTDVVGLARSIVASLRADLSDGVIQQSLLHFDQPFHRGVPPGLPPAVLCSDGGSIPDLRTPAGLRLNNLRGEIHCLIPFDMYSCMTFADRLLIEHHTPVAAARERSLTTVRSLLCSVSAEHSWAME